MINHLEHEQMFAIHALGGGGGTLHTFPSLYLVGPIPESWRKGGAPCTPFGNPPPPATKL